MRISDWSSDVCSSDLIGTIGLPAGLTVDHLNALAVGMFERDAEHEDLAQTRREWRELGLHPGRQAVLGLRDPFGHLLPSKIDVGAILEDRGDLAEPVTRERAGRSAEHTSELQSLMR